MRAPQNLHTRMRRAFEDLDPVETTDGFGANHAKGLQLSRKKRTFFLYCEERQTCNSTYLIGLWCQIHKLGVVTWQMLAKSLW